MTADRQSYTQHIDDIKKYIHDNAGEALNRGVLAEVAGFSVPHFHRIFTERVGENIAGYVRRVRLERAARKLRMGAVDITEVALAAGYRTHASFSRAFKRQYGLTPSQFRQLGCLKATMIIRNGGNDED